MAIHLLALTGIEWAYLLQYGSINTHFAHVVQLRAVAYFVAPCFRHASKLCHHVAVFIDPRNVLAGFFVVDFSLAPAVCRAGS